MSVLDSIKAKVERVLSAYRLGAYLATSHGARSLDRVSVKPEWCDTALDEALVARCPIMDVRHADGAHLAVISRDGIPEHAVVVGQVSVPGDTTAQQTVWLRADLQQKPGELQIGAEHGVRVVVGTSKPVDLVPLDDGFKIETSAGSLHVHDDGTVDLGQGALERLLKSETFLTALRLAFNSHAHPPTGGTPLVPWTNDGNPVTDPFHSSLSDTVNNA